MSLPTETPIAAVIYTHNRLDDFKANKEIIQRKWPEVPALSNPFIVHAYNGEFDWYREPTGEDVLLRMENYQLPGRGDLKHFAAATDLINEGIAAASEQCPEARFAVVTASDGWFVDPKALAAVLDEMASDGQVLASVPWFSDRELYARGSIGIGIDAFIVDLHWSRQHGLFPIDYKSHVAREDGGFVLPEQTLEANLWSAVGRSLGRSLSRDEVLERFHRLKRGAVIDNPEWSPGDDPDLRWIRDFNSRELGLATDHDPFERREFLEDVGFEPVGPHTYKFMNTAFLKGQWNVIQGQAAVHSFT